MNRIFLLDLIIAMIYEDFNTDVHEIHIYQYLNIKIFQGKLNIKNILYHYCLNLTLSSKYSNDSQIFRILHLMQN